MRPCGVSVFWLFRHEARALPRSLQSCPVLPPGRSRATCSWVCTNPTQRLVTRPQILRPQNWSHSRLVQFSSSSIQLSKLKTPQKRPPVAIPTSDSHENSAPSQKPKPTTRPHEQIYNIPNLLTFTRLIATPALGYLIIHDHHLYAFTLFLYAGLSDLLDGWIARKWHLQTVVGSVVDPMADKALMTTLVTCLAINGTLPLPLAALILGRDLSLATAAVYFRYASLPAPKTFRRYWDFSLPSAEVHPTAISKLNTFLQLGLIGTTMAVSLLHDPVATQSAAGGLLMALQDRLGGPQGVETLVKGMSGIVATTTVYSGLSYAWMEKAVTILGNDEALKRKQGFRGRMIIAGSFGSVIALAAWMWYMDIEEKRRVAGDDA